MKRQPLLAAAVERIPDLSKDEAYAAILCGEIFVNGERTRDPRATVPADARITRERSRYVSRGGLKLEHALDLWHVDVGGKVFLDAGSSTGGFTDCLLQRGAVHVHAVDVGYNQLAFRLRSDRRVSVHERTNISDITTLIPPADAAVADLSFRSIEGVAGKLLGLAAERWAIVLIKPQFELRGTEPGFDGVVRNTETLREVLESVVELLWREGAYPSSMVRSPILGRHGNREYLFLLRDSARLSKSQLLAELPSLL